ncbi:MAG: hypothetical protein ACRELA_17005 [Candidatus Rokuibacteriota bacterium]
MVDRAARAGVGVYPVTPYYLEPPRRAGLLLGYTALAEREITEGIRRLAAVISGRPVNESPPNLGTQAPEEPVNC